MDQSLTDLLSEVSTALAELAEAASSEQTNSAEISSTLLEMLDAMKSRKSEPAQVNVTVQPAAVKVEIMPAQHGEFRITHEYDKTSGRITASHVKRITKE